MIIIIITILLTIMMVVGIVWCRRNIEHDAIQKAHEDEQIDKLRKLM